MFLRNEIGTCLHRRSNHGHEGHKDRAEDIDDGEDEVHLKKNMILPFNLAKINTCYIHDAILLFNLIKLHLDRPLPLWVLPSEVGQAEHSQTNGELEREKE